MLNKILSLTMLAVFFLLLLTGSRQDYNYKGAERRDTDYTPRYIENIIVENYNIAGKSRQYYTSAPQRALVVGENILETFVALGIEDSILLPVGYGNPYFVPDKKYAAGYNKLKIEKGFKLNMENVIALKPDLIVGGQVVFAEKSLKSSRFWNERGIHTYCSLNANAPASKAHKETLEQEYEFILGLGKIYDREGRARQLVAAMQRDIEFVRRATADRPRQQVMIIEDLGGLVVYDSSKLAGDICVRLNGVVRSSAGGTIGIEDLIKADPDVLFVVKSGDDPERAADMFRNMPVLQNIKCVKNKRVYGIALNYTYNSAVKTGEGIKKMAAGMYPDLAEKIEGMNL